MTQHPAPSPEEEEEELSEEQEAKKALEEDVSQQDNIQLGLFVQFLGAGGLGASKYIGDTKSAFQTLTDPNLAKSLLDLEHPPDFNQTRRDFSIIGKRLRIGKEGEKESTRFKFFRFEAEISRDEYDRKSDALKIGQRIHQIADNRESQIKIERAISRFGLNEENAGSLKTDMISWMQENPGKGIDSELLTKTRGVYRAQIAQKGPEENKKETRSKEKEFKKDLETSREKTIEELQKEGTVQRAEEVINDSILNPQNPHLTDEQLTEHIKYIEESILPETGILVEKKLAGGFAEIPSELADEIMGYDVPTPTPTPLPPSKPSPATPISHVSPISRVLNIRDEIKNKLAARIAESAFGQTTKSVVKKATSSIAKKAAGKVLGTTVKAILSSGSSLVIDAVTTLGKKVAEKIPVVGGAISTVLDVPEKAITYGVAAIIIVAVGLPFLFLILMSSSSSTLFPIGGENAMKIALSPKNNLHAWDEFEKEYLTIKKDFDYASSSRFAQSRNNLNRVTSQEWSRRDWRQFEKENLIPLTLSLYSYRHDDVEKRKFGR